MAKSIVFAGRNQCDFTDIKVSDPEVGQVQVQAICSLISTGTETIVLGRKFSEGTNWDNWVNYPFYPGYSMIGKVVKSKSDEFKCGDIIASRSPHSELHNVNGSSLYLVPDNLCLEQAAWFALAKITFMGAKAAQVKLGSKVLIVGGGPIGQMAARWCIAAGAAEVGIVDMMGSRLSLALKGGVTHTFCQPLEECGDEIKAFFGNCADGIVIDSTGNAKVLPAALQITPNRGKTIILGDTGTPEAQHITGDVITRGLSIIGAHDGHADNIWTERRIVELFFNLLKRNIINLEGMNSHVFKPADAVKAYSTAETDRGATMGMIFDWRS